MKNTYSTTAIVKRLERQVRFWRGVFFFAALPLIVVLAVLLYKLVQVTPDASLRVHTPWGQVKVYEKEEAGKSLRHENPGIEEDNGHG